MRGRFGGFDETALIAFEQRFDYAGQPCGASHISAAYTCRVGVDDPSYRTEMVKQLMSSSYEDYEKAYAPFREEARKDATKNILNRIYGDSSEEPSLAHEIELSSTDRIRLAAANQAQALYAKAAELDTMGPNGVKAADELTGSKHLFEAMKWEMYSDVLLVSSGSLDLAWDGVQLDKSYASQFPNDKSAKFGQSRAGVDEHIYPTKALKAGLRETKPANSKELMSYVLDRSVRSVTSAPEDASFTAKGMKSSTPNPKVFMARYDAAKVKTFVLDDSITFRAKDNQRTLVNSVTAAKAKGMTKEEWISSVIKLPGSTQPPSVFSKPETSSATTASTARRSAQATRQAATRQKSATAQRDLKLAKLSKDVDKARADRSKYKPGSAAYNKRSAKVNEALTEQRRFKKENDLL